MKDAGLDVPAQGESRRRAFRAAWNFACREFRSAVAYDFTTIALGLE